MRINFFWKLSLTFLLLIVLVLAAGDVYFARTLRNDYLRAASEQLESLMRVVQAEPPRAADPATLAQWTAWMAHSGARVTLITTDGLVLADSQHDPREMENHAHRPEIQQALAGERGRAVRHSETLNRDLVYLAVRQPLADGSTIVVRLATPVAEVDKALADIRSRLWTSSLVMLLIAGAGALLISRALSSRIRRLQSFAHRVAEGDFQPTPVEWEGDELTDLTRAMNETASRLDQNIRSLREERNRSAAILRSMVEGVAVIASDGKLVFCNRAFCRILGVKGEECRDRPLLEVTRQPALVGIVRRALEGQEGASGEIVMGTVRPQSFVAVAAPVREEGTEILGGAVVVLHDITELRRLERVRRDFVANVSHELRTPLTSIQGFAETLLGGALEDRENARRFLAIIRDHAARMGRLTEDLLKLSLIEAGQLEMNFTAVNLADLVESCVETMRPKAERKRLTIETDCPAGIPPAWGDAGRLREVLQNLLDNAVQYTGEGGRITVSLGHTAEPNGRAEAVVVTVTDTGIGIPEADQARIFERFYRVDAARSREEGGTGLGLSIARHIVEAHRGRIWVESEVGRGSRFYFSIPTKT